MREGLISLFVTVLLAAAAFGGAVWIQGLKCEAKTSGMSLPHSWSWPAGCRVLDPKAGWIPLDNYRVI